MKRFLLVMAVFAAFVFTAVAQTTGSMSGTVTDSNGAVVPGATVTITNSATGAERKATTSDSGTFSVSGLQPGGYSVAVEGAGFKRSLAPNVEVGVSTVAQVAISLEVGAQSETVTVTAAQEVVNTTSPNITNVINTRQVVDLPLPTRNPLDLAALQAGIAVTGNATRTASIAGLRGSATNVTQDGINAMDNFVKTDSLFAISAPSLNSTAEFSITTGTVGSEAGRGVGQVNIVTKGGSNEFHGGVFYLHRNDALNANSFFNNLAGVEREREREHFFGFDIGGPIYFLKFGEGGGSPIWNGKDKAFFFFSYEGFRENFSVTRNRTVLTPEARQGIFRYTVGGVQQSVNLLQIGNVNTLNPITMAFINSTPAPNNTEVGDGLNTAGYRFNVSGKDNNDKYVFRYDHQLVKDGRFGGHKLEFVYNRSDFVLSPDTFNGLEATFPGGAVNNFQGSARTLFTGALHSTFGSNFSNVFRYGRQFAPIGFLADGTPSFGDLVVYNGITGPVALNGPTAFLPQGRNTEVDQYSNNVSWSKGSHLIRFGGDYQKVLADTYNDADILQSHTLGTNSANPSGITLTDFPGLTTANQGTNVTRAEAVYANLVGNLASARRTLNVLDPSSGFVEGATRSRIFQQKLYSLYAQDQWRMTGNFTLNFGLRWEFHGVPTIPNGLAIQPEADEIFGISGPGNLFNPNAPAGAAPGVATLRFVDGDTGIKLYNNDWNNFAPFVGIAYSPSFSGGIGKFLFGSAGQSAIRAGYSVSYLQDGFTVISNALGTGTTNPGLIQTAAHTTPTGVLTSSGVDLEPFTRPFQIPITDRENILASPNNGLWAIDPNLQVPYVQQWNIGYEREIFPNTAFEIRYVGNKGSDLWRTVDYNEVNIFENGFLEEFLNAQKNLAARNGAGFAPGCVGCVDLPLLTRLFASLPASSGFSSSGFISNLNLNNVGAMASTLAFSTTYRANRENPANGIPANFFVANPNAAFARLLMNDSESTYHSMQVELRRRFANGLQFQADYTFSKALTDAADAAGSQSDFSNYRTLRDPDLDWRRSNQDQTHRFVANGIYELPIGRGKWLFGDANGFVDRVIGGWTVGSIVTWSTRPPWYVQSGRSTFNTINTAQGAPAQLAGISFEDFKNNLGVFRHAGGVFFINPDILDITVSPTTGRVTGSTLKPGLLVAPAPGTWGNFPINSLNGPQYFNVDFSIVKRIPVTETVRLELKTTIINAFNRANFTFANQTFDSANFGRITAISGSPRVIHFTGSVRF